MESKDPYRVMVVDDSAVIRGLLVRSLEADSKIDVIASVQNGQIALDNLKRHDIEVVVLDIEMPVMDGLTALPLIIKAKPGIQVIMASTLTRKNAEISLRALNAGAADYVSKPTSSSELNSAEDFKRELVEKVKALGAARRASTSGQGRRSFSAARSTAVAAKPVGQAAAIRPRTGPISVPDAIAIGSSTGGPQALLAFFEKLKGPLKQPIFVTQHMPATFTKLLAEHIDRTSPMSCSEGKDGEGVIGGRIYLAPGDHHMTVQRKGAQSFIRIDQNPPENFCRPAVDPMLRSLTDVYGSRLLVIILTGMGSDGQRASEKVVAAGGQVIAQDKATSVVWGMPGAVATAGLCSAVLPLPEIAPYVQKLLMRPAA